MLTPQEKKRLMRLVYVSENNIVYGKVEERKEEIRREKKENKVLRVTNFQRFVSDYALPSACIA
jgi:hypothetical protein